LNPRPFVDEAMLTGETFPVEKSCFSLAADTALAKRNNSVWMGTMCKRKCKGIGCPDRKKHRVWQGFGTA